MEKKNYPNIIIFNPDSFRADGLGHLGNPAAITPNFDNIIKKDGVSFQNTFCQSPACTPSRCSFMSGWYPHTKGHRTMHHMMKDGEPVLLKTLKDSGYYVWWSGKNDLLPGQDPMDQYIDKYHRCGKGVINLEEVISEEGKTDKERKENPYAIYKGKLDKGDNDHYNDSDWDSIDAAIDIIKNSSSDKPFCIFLSIIYPHPYFAVEEPWYSMIDRSKVPPRIPTPEDWESMPARFREHFEGQDLENISEEFWTELRATYYGMCSRVDHQFGLLMKALKDKEIYDDTAVFAFSDHATPIGDYGMPHVVMNLFQDSYTKVPFIIKPPKEIRVKPGIRDALVELIDFPATVEELLGIEPGHKHFGRSLIDIIEGKTDTHREEVFCEGGRLPGEKQAYNGYLSENVHNIPLEKWNDKGHIPVLERSETPGPKKGVMIRNHDYKYIMRLYENDELYDLRADPREMDNLINEPSMSGIIISMKEKLLKFYLGTCDAVPLDLDDRFLPDHYNEPYENRKNRYE